MHKKVLLVGHCGLDGPYLKELFDKALDGVSVERVNDIDTLEREAQPGAVLLVNRELEGSFGTASGIELIAQLHKGKTGAAMMLVSDKSDAQKKAVAAGALPGFGKSAAEEPETVERVREALGPSEPGPRSKRKR